MAYLQVPAEVWEDESLTLHERVAIGVIWGWQGRCEYSNARWAQVLGCSKRHAQVVIGGLVSKGLVIKVASERAPNLYSTAKEYQLLLSPIAQPAPPIAQPAWGYSTTCTGGVHSLHGGIAQPAPNDTSYNTIYDPSNERVGAVAPTTPSPSPEKPKKEKPKTTVFDLTLTDADKRSLAEVYDRAMALRNLSPDQLPDKKAFLRACCEECRDWSVSGGKRKANWLATLKNWIRRSVKEYRPPQVQFKSAGERINEGMRKNREMAEAIRQREAEQNGTLLTSTTMGALEWKEK